CTATYFNIWTGYTQNYWYFDLW
nr:immunoglobulin heavy chain junction region [Macaca mulatta]MOV87276.1 immunoglobulin heavy chain junction region [Macaca mulatta]MOV89555.1 immunoglobulin heavy chain junction region [Macaca mulatta]MOV89782.1 immunoglobulin heavy chain junction region [Macaca mulatta]MOV90441.1 immunoglobulin heavy chain junction region [Macaca mulatta]